MRVRLVVPLEPLELPELPELPQPTPQLVASPLKVHHRYHRGLLLVRKMVLVILASYHLMALRLRKAKRHQKVTSLQIHLLRPLL